jgi:DNA processing protein
VIAGADRAPEEQDERDAWVVLAGASGVGPLSFARLIEALGDARTILGVASGPRGPERLVEATLSAGGARPLLTLDVARAIADAATSPGTALDPVRRAGLGVLLLRDAAYPSRLRGTALPPPVLFVRGDAGSLDRPHAVAIVGTRRPTTVGRATSGRIADAVASLGATVVSGLAVGIDAAAHAAAVRTGRPTVAVIGGGHERLYPAANRGLARGIVAGGGAVVSEFPPSTQPSRGTFPRRNRIISGLADATVVVEAGARSGALTTAAWALEQGRGLHIVTGRLDDPSVAGCLAFLREAGPEARVVAGIAELLEDLGLLGQRTMRTPAEPPPTLALLSPVELALAEQLAGGRGSVDELVATTGLAGATVLGALTALETRGLVIEAFGHYRPAGGLAGTDRVTHVRTRPSTAAW